VTTWSEAPVLGAGTSLRGKWKGRSYNIIRTLGSGANGTVYYVRSGSAHFALKVGRDTLDLQSEVNTLKALSQTATSYKNLLVDVDDIVWDGKEYPFFVMKYMEGSSLSSFMERRDTEWLYLIGHNLLRKLKELHGQGYIFGDLKMENIIVSAYGHVELIDFGGVTPIGRSVKQFTELYDRGFWNAGSRVAEQSYDLFSFGLLMLRAMDRQDSLEAASKGLPQNRSASVLIEMLDANARSQAAKPFLRRALQGEFASSAEAAEAWRKLLLHTGRLPQSGRTKTGRLLSVCFGVSIVLFAATLYWYWT